MIGVFGGERLTQGGAQREERDGPPELIRGPRRQRKPVLCRLVDAVAEQQGFAAARIPLHQHHAARAALGAPQQITDDPSFRLTSAHGLVGDRPYRRHYH